MTLYPLQDFQRVPDRKRELDPGSSSQMQGDEKMEIPEGVQAGSEQNNSLPSTGKGETVVKQMLLDVINFSGIPAAKTGDGFSLNQLHFSLTVNKLPVTALCYVLYISFFSWIFFSFIS